MPAGSTSPSGAAKNPTVRWGATAATSLVLSVQSRASVCAADRRPPNVRNKSNDEASSSTVGFSPNVYRSPSSAVWTTTEATSKLGQTLRRPEAILRLHATTLSGPATGRRPRAEDTSAECCIRSTMMPDGNVDVGNLPATVSTFSGRCTAEAGSSRMAPNRSARRSHSLRRSRAGTAANALTCCRVHSEEAYTSSRGAEHRCYVQVDQHVQGVSVVLNDDSIATGDGTQPGHQRLQRPATTWIGVIPPEVHQELSCCTGRPAMASLTRIPISRGLRARDSPSRITSIGPKRRMGNTPYPRFSTTIWQIE